MALPIFIVEGFFNLLTNVDIIIVGHLMQPDQVAIYFAAVKTHGAGPFRLFRGARPAAPSASPSTTPPATRARLAAFVRDTLHWTFWPSLAMVGAAGRCGDAAAGAVRAELRRRLSAPLHPVGRPARPRLDRPGGDAAHHGRPAAHHAPSSTRRRSSSTSSLNFLLIPRFGLAGAATATAIALTSRRSCSTSIVRTPARAQLLDRDGADAACGALEAG